MSSDFRSINQSLLQVNDDHSHLGTQHESQAHETLEDNWIQTYDNPVESIALLQSERLKAQALIQ